MSETVHEIAVAGGNDAAEVNGPDRLALADDAGCPALAADTAAAVGARDGLEEMIAHQMAAGHTVAMKLAGWAVRHSDWADGVTGPYGTYADRERYIAGSMRTAGAAARMMAAFRHGALALDRLRHGNRQTITIERVEG